MPRTVHGWLLGSSLVIGLAGCEGSRRQESAEPTSSAAAATPEKKSSAAVAALDVSLKYPATDNIGAKRRIRLEKAEQTQAHSPPEAWRIEFDEKGGFAGICWKNRAGNEGEAPGDDLSGAGYRRISFWAKGAAGGEIVEFRAGGLGHVKTRYRETFDVTAGKLKLSPSWTEHSIYVSNADLSSVMTPFCALFHQEDNPAKTVIYLDDIQYRG
jgi:hypothetical protein